VAPPVNAVYDVGNVGTSIGQIRLHRDGEAALIKVDTLRRHHAEDVSRVSDCTFELICDS
jgi:hypothetical protein